MPGRRKRFARRLAGMLSLGWCAGGVGAQDAPFIAPERLPIWPPALTALAQVAPPAPEKKAAPAPKAAPPAPESQLAPPENAPAGDTDILGELASLPAPNMIGHLLGAGRSISFFVNRSAGATFLNALGSTNLVNPSVADNNSPVPRDRVSFRFNHFADALSVTGASTQPPLPIPGSATLQALTATRVYNDDQYTFAFEKTFFDRRASLEFRLPFSDTLAPNLDLTYGMLTSTRTKSPSRPEFQGQQVYRDTVSTPQNTLGHEATQLGNLSLIFKWLFLQRDWLYLSAGLAGTVPTGNDTHVRVTDFLGPNITEVDTVRTRDFLIRNQTWALAPYLAGLVMPTERCFAQGFVQFDLPLNASAITYSEITQIAPSGLPLGAVNGVAPPFTVHDHLREQYLLQIDLGTGYWLLHRPEARWLTGFAPTIEGHYTTTLTRADVVTLPADAARHFSLAQNAFVASPALPGPQVGNLRNRVDILDLTLGTTFELANRARLATAVSLPLRGADNRTYLWEFQLQLNYYFGAPRSGRLPPAPTF